MPGTSVIDPAQVCCWLLGHLFPQHRAPKPIQGCHQGPIELTPGKSRHGQPHDGAICITLFSEVELRHPSRGEIARIGLRLVAFFRLPGFDSALLCCALAQETIPRRVRGRPWGRRVAGEAMLEAIARRRELLAETVHLVLC